MVTTIDRINNTIVIRQTQNGTVGAGSGGATDQQFSATANLLENVHALLTAVLEQPKAA